MHEHVCAILPDRLAAAAVDGPGAFSWIPGTRLETHIYNIRHIQHHAAQLVSRLRQFAGKEVGWVRNGAVATGG